MILFVYFHAVSFDNLTNIFEEFLAAMCSSSSDNVTQSVRVFLCVCVRPGPFFGVFVYQLR